MELKLSENDQKLFQETMEKEMLNPMKHFEIELAKIRTGRAHTSLVEDIQVACYGEGTMPLKNIASLAAPDSRLITIQPWDKSALFEIEKAISNSDIGLTPQNDGDMIKLVLPEMSSSRREELVKMLGKKHEECRVGIRNVRKEFNNCLRDNNKAKNISENFYNRLSDVLEKVTESYIKKADVLAQKKEKEITSF